MLTTTLSFANLHNHGELFANMLRARRELFIVHNKWNLPEAMGMEYDQYDTPASRWVVVHDEEGRVLAGNRLTPTTTQCGIYSYMIRDAQRGLLDTIPANLLHDEAPVAPHIWESSRLFVSHDVPASIRRRVHAQLIAQLGETVRSLGATHCLTLLAATWPRWADGVGVKMKGMGPVLMIDGIENQVVLMDFSLTMH
jgi:acyl homoserine lactone synthase